MLASLFLKLVFNISYFFGQRKLFVILLKLFHTNIFVAEKPLINCKGRRNPYFHNNLRALSEILVLNILDIFVCRFSYNWVLVIYMSANGWNFKRDLARDISLYKTWFPPPHFSLFTSSKGQYRCLISEHLIRKATHIFSPLDFVNIWVCFNVALEVHVVASHEVRLVDVRAKAEGDPGGDWNGDNV